MHSIRDPVEREHLISFTVFMFGYLHSPSSLKACGVVCFADTPTGELPYLEVGDKLLTQSLTIARYLAREFGKLLYCKFCIYTQ